MSLFKGGREGSSNDKGQIGQRSLYGRLCRWGVVRRKVLEDRVLIGVVGVCVDGEGRQGNRGSCDVWHCGYSGKVCI